MLDEMRCYTLKVRVAKLEAQNFALTEVEKGLLNRIDRLELQISVMQARITKRDVAILGAHATCMENGPFCPFCQSREWEENVVPLTIIHRPGCILAQLEEEARE